METIIQKMQELSNEMIQKNALLTLQLTEVKKKQDALDIAIQENEALAKDLKKREAAVQVVESVVELDKNLTARRAAIEIEEENARKKNEQRSAAIVAREQAVDEALESIDKTRAGLKAKEEKLESDIKSYKEKVLQGVQADLDAAKKKA